MKNVAINEYYAYISSLNTSNTLPVYTPDSLLHLRL